MEMQQVLHILSYVCSLSYLVCNAHALYYIVVSALRICTILYHIIS
jgi:hypothetical protein